MHTLRQSDNRLMTRLAKVRGLRFSLIGRDPYIFGLPDGVKFTSICDEKDQAAQLIAEIRTADVIARCQRSARAQTGKRR